EWARRRAATPTAARGPSSRAAETRRGQRRRTRLAARPGQRPRPRRPSLKRPRPTRPRMPRSLKRPRSPRRRPPRRRVRPDPRMTPSPEDVRDMPAIDSGGGHVRLRLDIAYDGTDFAGWATQAGQRTVAGVLEEALSTVFRTALQLRGAGRAD